ncbi:MAG: signal peptide peptidase SppA [Bacteroidota bacterium]
MKQFFKFTFATVLGVFLAWIIFIFLLVGIASLMSGGDDTKTIAENSVLELDLSPQIFDKVNDDPFADFNPMKIDSEKPLELLCVLNNIEKAKDDPKIKGIAITSGIISAGSSHLTAIRNKLKEFKDSGKFIIAYSDIYTQKGYWLSSVADTVFLNPVGSLQFKGLAAEITFFKKFQDKYGVKFDVIRHGKYKSAVEPFIEDKMSEANRQQTSALIGSIWNTYLNDISESRGISIEKLNEFADMRDAELPIDAMTKRLIDRVSYENDFYNSINHAIGEPLNSKPELVSLKDYRKVKPTVKKEFSRDKIAIIYAEGNIIYSQAEAFGSDKVVKPQQMVKAIRELKNDKKVKGVVLRVNSGGGSALTSDLIWHELELLKEIKPYVVSFGNVAASGGYYIACGADKIYAQENTITGSIGVFGMLPNLEKAAENMGITSEVVSTNKQSFDFSLIKGASPEIKQLILRSIENTYKTFVTRVVNGRKMKFEDVDAIGQGRVWSGKDGIEIGLVDEIGGLEDAIAHVAEKAELENYRLVSYPKEEDKYKKLLESFSSEAKLYLIKEELGDDAYKLYSDYKSYINSEGIQARIPFNITIN